MIPILLKYRLTDETQRGILIIPHGVYGTIPFFPGGGAKVSQQKSVQYVKANRIFTSLRRYAWLFVFLVALGGLIIPHLGLLIIPMMCTLAIMGLFRGKHWCGNYCPHGSLFDGLLLKWSRNKRIPLFFRHKLTMAALFVWFMFMLGSRLVQVFNTWGAEPFWESLGAVFVTNYLMVTVAGTILALLVSSRTWCSVCPMGTFSALLYALGTRLGLNRGTDKKITLHSPHLCRECGHCSRVCPLQLEPYKQLDEHNQVSEAMCIRCSTCVEHCPIRVLSLRGQEEARGLMNPGDHDSHDRDSSCIAP